MVSAHPSLLTLPHPTPRGPCYSSQLGKMGLFANPYPGEHPSNSFEASSTFCGCSQLLAMAQTSFSGL